ncbi:MAG: hypothetical protein ABFD13_02755 [Candidatus Cryosericum sp.]|nr:hypothetical protein [bacterium]
MSLSESDTRAKLIDLAPHEHQWTEDLIRREESADRIRMVDGNPISAKRCTRGAAFAVQRHMLTLG